MSSRSSIHRPIDAGEPVPVRVHDFIDKKLGKAVPYGSDDVARDESRVNVGIHHDTSEFAVESLRPWWRRNDAGAHISTPRDGA